jgi:hypothetical protein
MRGSPCLILPSIVAGSLGLVALACEESHFDPRGDSNEIVFGIRQTPGADGGLTVSGDYEYLSLAHQGGWVAQVFRDGDGEGVCYFERFDHRIGKPHVESGAASFTGGQLPASGLQILANGAAVTESGPAWTDGQTLTFEVAGFAMPPIRTLTFHAPSTTLAITSISPAAAPSSTDAGPPATDAGPPATDAGASGDGGAPEDAGASADAGSTASTPSDLVIRSTDDVKVTWTPTDGLPHHADVLVALVTEEANGPSGEVRCFGSGASGSAVIPSLWVGQLFSAVAPGSPVKGHLEVATHAQVTTRGRGDWTVYVVATSAQRELTFTGSR